ncbi:T9SS type A sorting domain-containing protein [Saccharicrinis sp. 156]|uniref:T9SS type A sorting domain-containing protein n=1 Tax=Saccharicrinis sp. 156 TaxID=3417574 RepID=UPI003D351A51
MEKNLVFISACLLLVFGVVCYWGKEESVSNKKLIPTASSDILKQHINKKIERRKNGYAKPDRPDKYMEYLKSLVSLNEQSDYKEGYKIKALKSAIAHRNSLKSASETLAWVQRGPGNIGGRTRCVIVDPDDKSTWFAGAVSGGIWKTANAGASWDIISPDIPNLATVCLSMAPSNPDVIYAGTGEGYYNIDAVRGDGIFKSVDRGNSWSALTSTTSNSQFYYVNSIVVAHSDENKLWAATNQGVFKSVDGGISWDGTALSQYHRYQRIIIHPVNEDILWVARNGKGIFKTENGGEDWFLVYDMSSFDPERIEIAVSGNNPDVLYAMDVNSKVYYSQDGGTEWAKATESGTPTEFLMSQGWYNNVLAVNPMDTDRGFIGGIDLYSFELGNDISSTGTQAFSVSSTFSSVLDFEYFGGSYSNGGVCVLSGFNNKLNEVQIQFGPGKSQKAHRLVRKASESDFTHVFAEDSSKVEYVGYGDIPFEVINTTTGEQLHVSIVDGNENGKFDVYPGGYELIWVHDVLYEAENKSDSVSLNNGNYQLMTAIYPKLAESATWDEPNLPEGYISIRSYDLKDRELMATQISDWSKNLTDDNYAHADHHHITVLEGVGNPFSVIVGNDGGVGSSSDGGATWTSKSNGYVTSQFYGITRHPKQYQYFGGLQDNGSALSGINPNKLSDWEDLLGGDGFDVVWHPRKPQLMMGTYYYNQLRKTEDGGDSWTVTSDLFADSDDGELAPFVTCIASCLADPDLLFVGGNSGLWKSSDFGDSWKNISMGTYWGYTSNSTPKIAISNANPDIVWAGVRVNALDGFTKGRVHVSTDGGETFSSIVPFANMGAITDIVTHPVDPETAYLVFSMANRPKIVRTTDLGETWEDLSGFGLIGSSATSSNNFPNVAVNTMQVMPFSTPTIWAGTEIGLFISEDDGLSWAYANNGIPAVSIWDIKIVGDEVILGTHGLGVWTVKMAQLSNEIKHPFIDNAGINPRGDYVLSTVFDVELDSFELYNDKGLVKTYRNVGAGNRIDTVSSSIETSEKLQVYGYLNGQKYSSNVKHLEVVSVEQPITSYINKFDDEVNLDHFVGSYFSIQKGEFSNDAIHSPHPYPENVDLIYTLKYPIIISNDEEMAFLKYYDIAYLETGETNSEYPDEDFFDYAVVEGSKDGLEWKALAPGYDFSYEDIWNQGVNDYKATPSAKDFTDHHVNLYDTFAAGDTILIRFKLHSDPFEDGWGWVIDNIRIQGQISSVNQNSTSDFEVSVFPNPTKGNRVRVLLKDVYMGVFEVSVFGSSGQQFIKKAYFKGSEIYEQEIELPELPKGFYLVKIRMGHKQMTEKLRVN